MTVDIDFYISQTDQRENISQPSTSPCYRFDDGVVLVKYTNNYGIAREKEEEVARFILEARKKGVRTPVHLAIKRENDDHICWVLQEAAKGVLKLDNNYESMVLKATEKHYEQIIHDLCHLIGTGIELKPKNIFYDSTEGFSFIDLLKPGKIFEDKFSDVRWVFNHACMTVESRNLKSSENMEIRRRCFLAMEKVIPEFDKKYKRRLLRCLDEETLGYFLEKGIFIGELTLNDEERTEFERNENEMLKSCLDGIASGEFQYWQIKANEIRNRAPAEGLVSDWKYHPRNPLRPDDFEKSYDYNWGISDMLEAYQGYLFDKKLGETVDDNNPYLTEGKKKLADNLRNDRDNLYILFMLFAKHSPDAIEFLEKTPDLINKSLDKTGMSPIFMAMRTDNEVAIIYLLEYLSEKKVSFLDLKDARGRSLSDYFEDLSDKTKKSVSGYFRDVLPATRRKVSLHSSHRDYDGGKNKK